MLYYVFKIIRIVGVYFFSKRFAKGIQFKQSPNKPMAIILDHTSPSVMHFGDLLFFLDIVWLANDNDISKANLPKGKHIFKILDNSVKNISADRVINFIKENNL